MNIALISDENYAAQSAVTLQSFFENNEGCHEIYFITIGITDESRLKLESLCREHSSNFHYKSMDEKKLDPFEGIGYWSKYTFMKLFIPELLPPHVDKVLYLDVDILVKGSLSVIYDMNIEWGGVGVAAVEDVPSADNHKKRCNLSSDAVYINSGLMLMNLPLWRNEIKHNSFMNYIEENRAKYKINDQDVINSVFENRIIPLDWKYNVTSAFFGFKSSIWKLYRSQYKSIRKNPVVLHFTNSNKPWRKDSYHVYKKEWFDVLKRTAFVNEIQWHNNSTKQRCILVLLRIVEFFRIYVL